MNINFNGFHLNAESKSVLSGQSEFIFFIHGFTGSSDDWNQIIPGIDSRFTCIALDLIGHGKSDSPEEFPYYISDSISDQVLVSIDAFTKGKIILAGYSMGGRAALNFSLKYPGRVKGMILESTSPGIEDDEERKERIKEDAALSELISSGGIQEFIDYWMNIDLFATQLRFSKDKRERIRQNKLKNNVTGLVNILKGFGTGIMLPLYSRLHEIKCRTLLITGGLDIKFTELNSVISKKIPYSEHIIIQTAGHNTHLEEPRKFIDTVNDFLTRF